MKRPVMQDERVSRQSNEANSEAFGILMIVLLCAVLVQLFLLHAPFKQYAVEAICFVGMSIYIITRYIMLGINVYSNDKLERVGLIVRSIIVGITVTAVSGTLLYSRNGELYQENGIGHFIAILAGTFVGVFILSYAASYPLYYLNKKKQAQIQKRLDEAEHGK